VVHQQLMVCMLQLSCVADVSDARCWLLLPGWRLLAG
jgi:hypothetical protein